MAEELKEIEDRKKRVSDGFLKIFGSSQEKKEGQESKGYIEIRKGKALANIGDVFRRTPEILYYFLLLIIIWIGTWIRTRNIPLIQANSLPADPDSALFLRYMQTIIDHGYLPLIDNLRYIPLGFNTLAESRFLPYFLAYMYKIIHIFNPAISVLRVDMLYPVILFPFIIIVFFLFVKKIFDWKTALVSSALLAVIPAFLQRTMIGLSDKEPLGMLLLFLCFYFLVSALKEEKIKFTVIYGLFAGLFAGLLGLVWGAISFVFMIVGLTFLTFLFLGNFKKKDFASYLAFLIAMTPVLFISARFSIIGLLTDPSSAIIYFPLLPFLIYFLMQSKLKEKLILKLPHNVTSILVSGIIAIIGFIFLKGFSSTLSLLSDIKLQLLHPFGIIRLTLTVAENQQPFISSWIDNFGYLFWLMIFGVVLVTYLIFSVFNNKYKYWFTGISAIFIFSLIFSRYKPDSIFNGTNTISQFTYFGGMILFVGVLIYVYLNTFKKDKKTFEKFSEIDKTLLFLFICFVWFAIGARGAIRLIFLFSPIVVIFASFLIIKIVDYGLKFKDNVFKIIIIILISFVAISIFYTSFQSSASYTSAMYPNLNPQWTNAMNWVKDNTPEDSVFSHWWDYGYWVQTAGERATVLDGGNALPYWDHLMGRYVLTSPHDEEALEMLYTHNSTHLLIDPSDIGKYPAYSLIGSDENYDRYSWINVFGLNEQATQETRNGTIFLFQGGTPLDEDFMWNNELFIGQRAGIGGFIVETIQEQDNIILKKPTAIFVKDNKRVDIPLNCIFFNNRKIEYEGEGLDGCLYIMPKLTTDGRINNLGTAYYLSPRTKNSLMARLYLFGEDNPNFKLVHVEEDFVVTSIREQSGLNIPSIIDFNGIRAPIKIWEINYPYDIKSDSFYLETDFPNQEIALSKENY
ncbi:MAG: hypothetical protein KJ767_00045 [Nanoarchaeota archaeon]|nr:hypothetical protein [Nanoarchaeota archaeon]